MNLIQAFKKTVSSNQLFSLDDRLLIAVSGGSDSTALCHICKELGYDFGIVHVNYMLREEDSDEDAVFVESLAKNLQVPYYSMAIDCMSFATENRLSVQEAARQIRYDFFESILAMYGYKSVLTAHHAADNLETMLYTFLKGASLNALRGIPIERGYITRPLLYTEKSVIDAYIRRAKLTYRHDVSNDSVKYKRNYIRHEIIPRLEEINPSIESTLINTAQLGASYQALIDSIIAKSKVEFLRTKKLDLRSCTLPAAQHAWLYEIINHLGYNSTDVQDIWNTYESNKGTGKTFLLGNYKLVLDRHLLVLENAQDVKPYESMVIPSLESALRNEFKKLDFERIDHWSTDNKGAIFKLSKIKFPLTLRRWLPGDRFRPKGMNGQSKKVKDFLTDLKITGRKRSEIQVLISGREIIWIVGYRLAESYAADKGDSDMLQITYLSSKN